MIVENMKGRVCCEKPIEQHEFKGEDYLCYSCRRPRALHQNDGFRAVATTHSVSMDVKARYGKHPYFWKPNTIKLNKTEQETVDRACKRHRRLSS